MKEERILNLDEYVLPETSLSQAVGAGMFSVPVFQGVLADALQDYGWMIKEAVPQHTAHNRISKHVNVQYICATVNCRLGKLDGNIKRLFGKEIRFPTFSKASLMEFAKRIELPERLFLPQMGVLSSEDDRIILGVTELGCYYLNIYTYTTPLSHKLYHYYKRACVNNELSGELLLQYLADATIATVYAELHRWVIYYEIVTLLGWKRELTTKHTFSTLIDFISPEEMMVCKGKVRILPKELVMMPNPYNDCLRIVSSPSKEAMFVDWDMRKDRIEDTLWVRKEIKKVLEVGIGIELLRKT